MREIPPEVAAAEGVPADLDSTQVGPYAVPSPRRRRLAGAAYLVGAAVAAAGALSGLPAGMWGVAAALMAVAIYHLVTAWDLVVREGEALELANRHLPFAAGHASAQVTFAGWRGKPIWNVLVFSADDPPSQRGLVRVDAMTGRVVGSYTEAVPAAR